MKFWRRSPRRHGRHRLDVAATAPSSSYVRSALLRGLVGANTLKPSCCERDPSRRDVGRGRLRLPSTAPSTRPRDSTTPPKDVTSSHVRDHHSHLLFFAFRRPFLSPSRWCPAPCRADVASAFLVRGAVVGARLAGSRTGARGGWLSKAHSRLSAASRSSGVVVSALERTRGRRPQGWCRRRSAPHGSTLVGAGLLWFGCSSSRRQRFTPGEQRSRLTTSFYRRLLARLLFLLDALRTEGHGDRRALLHRRLRVDPRRRLHLPRWAMALGFAEPSRLRLLHVAPGARGWTIRRVSRLTARGLTGSCSRVLARNWTFSRRVRLGNATQLKWQRVGVSLRVRLC